VDPFVWNFILEKDMDEADKDKASPSLSTSLSGVFLIIVIINGDDDNYLVIVIPTSTSQQKEKVE
jgi:hypothetical protein